MSFTSIKFWVFLPIIFFLFYLYPRKYRWTILLIGSYVFYAFAGIQYLLLLAYVTLTAYTVARYIEKKGRLGKLGMTISIVSVILPLIFFKYTGFLIDNLNIIIQTFKSAHYLSSMRILLPLGISFYTFSALGYVIDVSRKRYSAFHNPFHLATGISFFPCLVSGPIECQGNLVVQLVNEVEFDYSVATYGLKQIAWGLFQKIVIADNLAVYVDRVFSDFHAYTGSPLLIASLFFTFQIYCDFSGYSDIAIGIARLFGVELSKNFDSPYFSESLQEFWRRWHISLSSWLRDYVYIPLGGNRKENTRKHFNLLATMLVSGIWHGASWKFVVWGGIHGITQVIESSTGINEVKSKNVIVKMIRTVSVFTICSTLWLFFKSYSLKTVGYVLANMFNGIHNPRSYCYALKEIGLGKIALLMIFFVLSILFVYDYYSLKLDVIKKISSLPLFVRWSIYILFLLIVAQLSAKGVAIKFMYAGF